MKIAVLFDGAGLARLGLEQAGHICCGIELDPWKHYLSKFVGSGSCLKADVTLLSLHNFDAIWASPPCQYRSSARTQGPPVSQYSTDYLKWCLDLVRVYPTKPIWIENVIVQDKKGNQWGKIWNVAQFYPEELTKAIFSQTGTPFLPQNRNRVIGGNYISPIPIRDYKKTFPNICPCVTATEYKGCASDKRRASRFYGRRLTIDECARHQGFQIPIEWRTPPKEWIKTKKQWEYNVFESLGNGFPVYAAAAFGRVYK